MCSCRHSLENPPDFVMLQLFPVPFIFIPAAFKIWESRSRPCITILALLHACTCSTILLPPLPWTARIGVNPGQSSFWRNGNPLKNEGAKRDRVLTMPTNRDDSGIRHLYIPAGRNGTAPQPCRAHASSSRSTGSHLSRKPWILMPERATATRLLISGPAI